jgi:hypothetical protein
MVKHWSSDGTHHQRVKYCPLHGEEPAMNGEGLATNGEVATNGVVLKYWPSEVEVLAIGW